MKILTILWVFLLYSLQAMAQLLPPAPPASPVQERSLQWETERLEKGVYYKYYSGDDLFDSRQSISLAEVWLDSTNAFLSIAFDEGTLVATSTFAGNSDALVAINGSFFDTQSGSSVVFLKVNGEVIAEGAVNNRFYTESGAIAWNNGQQPAIYARPDSGWKSLALENVLSSGPLLILDSTIMEFNGDAFNQNRHPRTAVALTNDNRLLLAAVDGRSFQSYGMTIPELAGFLYDLNAEQALNLDGGGSTTMWVRDLTENGIVNYPSDNLEFDREGERNVSNALLLIVD